MNTIAIIVSALVGILIAGVGFWLWKKGNHSLNIIGWVIVLYGLYFSLFTGSFSSLVVPGIGSIALGAATGGAVGWATAAVIGTVGVATGGAGIAIGALGMAAIGAVLGAIGAGSGGFGIETTTKFLVTPWFWAPLILLGLALIIKSRRKKQNDESADENV